MKRIFVLFMVACFLSCAPLGLYANDIGFDDRADEIEDENDDDIQDFMDNQAQDEQLRGGDVGREDESENKEEKGACVL
ncbi:MAG: hypothetical protein HQ579_01725 [Candidatus Omnitrophica bacterium]|nr:hypothetical protein [Candidatus Omnitrophota bacterium]